MDKGKGKAIATDSNGNNSRKGTCNQGERLDCPRSREINFGAPQEGDSHRGARPDGSRTTGEIILGPHHPTNNNLGVDTSEQWVMRGGSFIREMNLPPLARRSIYDSTMNPWVRVYVPPIIPPPNFNNFGEGSSAQGAAMFNGSTTRAISLSAPPPIFDIYGRLVYLPSAPQVLMFNSYPTTRVIINLSTPHPNLNNSREGTSAQGVAWHGGGFTSPFVSSLNPNAPKWSEAPKEARSLFVTFSHGYPLTTNQVFWFLAASFGIKNLVEVDINQPWEGPAHFGRLVFKTLTIPMMILQGREEATIMIYGKSMICKKWRPRRDR